jgi:hypothetical protein
MHRRCACAAGARGALFLLLTLGAGAPEGGINDYPTAARADYVLGCMAANGNTQQSLERCSCSIDVIASVLPYEKYVQAETVLRIAQAPGQRSELIRSSGALRDVVAELRRAQIEAEVQCFP